jgi:AhpD family alkylhydroperoxidase
MAKQPWYIEHSKTTGPAYRAFHDAPAESGVLDTKTRELLMLALACTHRCAHCTENHIKRAMDAGCTKEEITETLLITAVEGAGTQLYWAKDIFDKHLGG